MRLLVVMIAMISLSACSSVPTNTSLFSESSPSYTHDKLQRQYHYWHGTPYQLGGLNRQGVDCSGLVYRIYRDEFDLILPRTTHQQVALGDRVARQHLKVGDLVFFKTGFKVRHVGIYMGKGQFLHASTQKGVTVSALDNVYWRDKYWQARRLDAD